MTRAGFQLVQSDPDAARDFAYRARYYRSKSGPHPALHAYLEYYSAIKAYSLKITTTDTERSGTYAFIVKNHQGDLRDLLDRYFGSMDKGVPLSGP
jgi:hypothetical protein